MKIAILGDTHFGAREGKEIFHQHFQRFYDDVFFPTLVKEGITTVLQLGDLFDRRKYIDYYSLKRSKEYFFDKAKELNIQVHALLGNHDIALRNSLEINSPELLLKEYDNFHPITTPTELSFPGTKVLMVPWICSDNAKDCFKAINETDADVVCGHFEISGFAMYRGVESHDGIDPKTFERFDYTFSGHYHHRSSRGNIYYVGTPYEITAMDYADPRGFHIFDTEKKKIKFVENKHTIFEKVIFNDNTDPKEFDYSKLKNKFVKIVVESKNDFYKFDVLLDNVDLAQPYDVKIAEYVNDLIADELDESVDIEDTKSILEHYVQSCELSVDKDKLTKLMTGLYIEAINT